MTELPWLEVGGAREKVEGLGGVRLAKRGKASRLPVGNVLGQAERLSGQEGDHGDLHTTTSAPTRPHHVAETQQIPPAKIARVRSGT